MGSGRPVEGPNTLPKEDMQSLAALEPELKVDKSMGIGGRNSFGSLDQQSEERETHDLEVDVPSRMSKEEDSTEQG